MAMTSGTSYSSSSTPDDTIGTTGVDPMSSSPSTGSSSGMGGTPDMGGQSQHTAEGQEDVMSRVVQRAHETVDRLAETAAPHVQRMQQGLSSTGETLHDRADQMRDVSDEWAQSLRETVRDNPLAAVATALAVGILFARLTS